MEVIEKIKNRNIAVPPEGLNLHSKQILLPETHSKTIDKADSDHKTALDLKKAQEYEIARKAIYTDSIVSLNPKSSFAAATKLSPIHKVSTGHKTFDSIESLDPNKAALITPFAGVDSISKAPPTQEMMKTMQKQTSKDLALTNQVQKKGFFDWFWNLFRKTPKVDETTETDDEGTATPVQETHQAEAFSPEQKAKIAQLYQELNDLIVRNKEINNKNKSLDSAFEERELDSMQHLVALLKEVIYTKERQLLATKDHIFITHEEVRKHQKEYFEKGKEIAERSKTTKTLDVITKGSNVVLGITAAISLALVIAGFFTGGISVAFGAVIGAIGGIAGITKGAVTIHKTNLDAKNSKQTGEMKVIKHEREKAQTLIRSISEEMQKALEESLHTYKIVGPVLSGKRRTVKMIHN